MSFNMKLDSNSDIEIYRGVIRVEGIAYVAQLTKNNLLTILGEWDLDESIGIDWYSILGTNYSLSIIQGVVAQAIKDTKGVDNLDSIDISRDAATRTVSINFTATSSGEAFTETISI